MGGCALGCRLWASMGGGGLVDALTRLVSPVLYTGGSAVVMLAASGLAHSWVHNDRRGVAC